MRTGVYPFTAIVGQEDMKLALILNVINPGLGGVLIKGEKGTAKSTAVRAIADLLPAMEAVGEDESGGIAGQRHRGPSGWHVGHRACDSVWRKEV